MTTIRINRLLVLAIYNRKGKDKVTTLVNYERKMFIVQDCSIVKYWTGPTFYGRKLRIFVIS